AADACQHFLDTVEAADRASELVPYACVGAGQTTVATAHAGGCGGLRNGASDRQLLHNQAPAPADHIDAADDGVQWHEYVTTRRCAVGKGCADGTLATAGLDPGRVGRNQHTGDAEIGGVAQQAVGVVHTHGQPQECSD